MIVPISIIVKGKQYFFPRKYRGKDLPEAEVKTLYAMICPEIYARPSALRLSSPPRANSPSKPSPRNYKR